MSLGDRPSGASAKLGGKLQAWPGRGRAGCLAGKCEPRGKGLQAKVHALRLPSEQVVTAGTSPSFHQRAKSKAREVCGTGAEQCLHLVKPKHDLDKLAKANSGSLLLPRSWQKQIFFFFFNFVTNRGKRLAANCRLFLSLPAQP